MSLAQLVQTIPVESLNLSEDEMRAYPRWYTDLLLRKGNEQIRLDDTLTFLDNFLNSEEQTALLQALENQVSTLDPTQFYAFIRLAGHVLEGHILTPQTIFQPAKVPQPKSILSQKRKHTNSNGDGSGTTGSNTPGNPFRKQKPLDIDSFTTFMLTGNRPGEEPPKRKKQVTFDNSPQVAEAAARSMDELMRQRGMNAPAPLYQPHPVQIPVTTAEEEPEEEVEIDTTSFQNVNIDSVLHHGTSNVAPEASLQHPTFSPSPSPSPQPQFPNQPPQQFQQQPQQPQLQVQNELSRFVPLQPTPTGGGMPSGSLNNSSSSLPVPLTPQQQFLQTMSPHRGPSPVQQQQTQTQRGPSPVHIQNGQPQTLPNANVAQPQVQLQAQVPMQRSQVPQLQEQQQQQQQSYYGSRPPPPPPPPRNNSEFPTIAPPPPNPRRNISGGTYLRPPPPPPPPPRNRASSSPGVYSPQFGQPQVQAPPPPPPPPPRNSQMTSAPDLLADLKALQEEVDRIRRQ